VKCLFYVQILVSSVNEVKNEVLYKVNISVYI